MSDFRSGLLGEGMLHIDVLLPSVLLAGIYWDSLSMCHYEFYLLKSPGTPISPHLPILTFTSRTVITFSQLPSPLWSSFLTAATVSLDEPKSPLSWFPALLVESLTCTTRSCLCLGLQPHLPLLSHASRSAEKPDSQVLPSASILPFLQPLPVLFSV